jgi:alanine-synthesizing transaminase
MFARRTGWVLEKNALTREVESRRERGLPLIDLTESNPTRCGFEYASAAILQALANPEAMRYQPEPRGLPAARQAVITYYAERGGAIEPEQVFLTSSTSESYSFLFRLLADPGDSVLVPQPSYPLFDFLTGLNDLETILYPLVYESDWKIDLEALAARLAAADRTFHLPRAIIVVHPNNPTGSFVHADQIDALLELCRRHDLALIADEVFADYNLGTSRPSSHAGVDSVLTFTLSGLSKISALPQMKLGWIVVSGPVAARADATARLEIIADTYLPVSAPVAAALPELLGTRREIQSQIITRVRQNLAELDRQLDKAAGATRLHVEGGWYAVLQMSSGGLDRSGRTGTPAYAGREARGPAGETPALPADDEDLAAALVREDGVLVHPGHFYEFLSSGFLVLSLIPPAEAFSQGVSKLIARRCGT